MIQYWPLVILFSLVTLVGKILSTCVGAFLTGQSLYTTVRMGLSMAQIGEFSFIIVALGLSLQVIDSKLYPLIVAVSAITTFTTPYLIRLSAPIADFLEMKLPEKTQFFLESYSAWVYRTLIVSHKESFFSSVTVRLLINGLLVAIIFSIVRYIADHHALFTFSHTWYANILLLLISLIAASPFIWGMLFSSKKIKLAHSAETSMGPILFLVWFVTLSEIAFLSLVYFHALVVTMIFILIAIVFMIIAYRHLERSYHWFEGQLINNLQQNKNSQRYEELAPWDTHLIEMVVGSHSPFAGKTLSQSQIRQQYGINIVAIGRGPNVIQAPRGEQKIMPHDKLVVLGNDKQIEAFRPPAEAAGNEHEVMSSLDNFILSPVFIEKDHPLIGTSIRHSQIRERISGMVVGLERNNRRILNPDPDTILREDDLLFVVGEAGKVSLL
jgi:CPA2 family monovalent cation:H+ antiporter-2